ncbi:cytochrome b [Halomonas cerina]|uniref:Cytochrome b561 n=1 Tax=Halomonas cerina TaxID=447424 RepID=A0A839UZ98_9GAMM|nr:cytochrome b [Halomonas cerina]MBB3188843.1 cytochrome b561 [Halomonas cerina]
MWRNTSSGWGLVSILLHWLSALAIIALFVLGWWMTGLGYYDSWYNLAPWWHKSVGMLVLFATLARLAWRAVQPTPTAAGTRLERALAHLGHIALYVLMLVVLVSGYLISTADGAGISVFGAFEVPALISHLPDQATVAGTLHWYSALALMLIAAGHALAALKHHWIDRHDVLWRMIDPTRSRRPFGRSTSPTNQGDA